METLVAPDGTVRARWSGRTKASPLAAWASFSDTDRLNRLAGFDWKFEVTEVRGGGMERLGWFRWMGMKQLWEERPYRWVAPREYGVERIFRGGPIAGYRTRMVFTPETDGGTSMDFEMTWRPKASLFARPIAHTIRTGAGKQLSDAMDALVAELDGASEIRLVGPPPLNPQVEAILSKRLEGVQPPKVARGLRSLIRHAPLSAQDRMQPLRLAEEWGLPADVVILGMIGAARERVLEAQWGVLCPSCHAPKSRTSTYSSAAVQTRCIDCEVEFEGSPADGIDLSFRTHPELRNYEIRPACLGSPGRTPHIVLRQSLPPGGESAYRVELEPGRYRLRVWPAVDSADLVVRHDVGPRELTVTLADDGLCPAVLTARSGEVVLHFRSLRSDARDIVLERRFAPPYTLTAAALEAIPGAMKRLAHDAAAATTQKVQIPTAYVLVAEVFRGAEAFRGKGELTDTVRDLLLETGPIHLGKVDRRVYAAWTGFNDALWGARRLAGALDVCSAMGRGLVTSPIPSGPAVDQAIQALHTSIPGATAMHASMVKSPEVVEALEGESAPGHLVEGPALAGHEAWLLTFKEAGDGLDRLSVTPFGASALGRNLPPSVGTVGETLGDRYLLEDLIATGGFGAVYVASDQRSSLKVIVKTMQPSYVDQPTDLQRFFNEARLAARLKHPNTVRTLDFGHTEDGRLYIVLERLLGSDLNDALGDELRISPGNTCDVGIGVLRSLTEAHGIGLIHRDLKPANLFVVNSAVGPDAIKVIDFGIAKDLSGRDPSLTHANMVVGTMQYMPPEPLLGKPVDGRTDLYSLGLVLYRCLSGHVPFGSLDGFGPVLHRIEHPCPPLREACPDPSAIPSALGDCVMRAVERDPAARWPSAQEMLGELEAIRGQLERRTV